MALRAGSRLGGYDILSLVGAGGMGEVYRARDTKLGREVAIKILLDDLARDPEHLARFEREAQLLASVNHPGIATLHGLEEADGRVFLVMELVPGETLGERLSAGPLPMAEALDVAQRVAAALETAHEKGIVHRDLKPANVKMTPEGGVKLLDFGLAKAVVTEEPPAGLSGTPTLPRDPTRAGTVLGTTAYMSPEQARGRPVDKRTDVWSFGCLLYELLTGRRAFDGESPSDIIVAILDRQPSWRGLPAATSRPLRQLLRRCLEKEAALRFDDAGALRLEMDRALAKRARSPRPAARRASPERATSRSRGPSREPRSGRPRLTQVTFRDGIEEFPAWSPDGVALLFAGEVGGLRKVFLKRLDSGEELQLSHGEHDDIQPDWSPDGRSVVFVRAREPGRRLEPGDVYGEYAGGDVWALDLSSSRETKLLEDGANPAYSPDGSRIAVDAAWVGSRRLWIVDSQGRNPQQATGDVSEAVVHLRPRWSPTGTRLVFQNVERTKLDVRVVDLATRRLTWVTNDVPQDFGPVWSFSGRHIYFSSYRSGGLNLWRVPVSAQGSPTGPLQQVTNGAGQDVEVAVARDAKRLAFATLRQNADLWRLPVSQRTGEPVGPPEQLIATTREDSRGAWSPDGQTIAFNSDRGGEMNIWLHSLADGSTRQLTRGPGGDFQPQWSPDGRRITFFSSRAANVDIWSVDLGSGALSPLTNGSSIDANPFFSPDGSLIAYQSDEGGRLEIWVMNADGSGKRQLTRAGVMGHFHRWSADGQAVCFRSPGGGRPQTLWAGLDGRDPELLPEVAGGSHISFSPDFSRIMDVVGHKALWVSPLEGGAPQKVFEFEDPDVRIDYPSWSPDGRWVLFDRFRPQGGDIWMLESDPDSRRG